MKTLRTLLAPLICAVVLLTGMVLPVQAHPHSFMEALVTFVFDDNGLTGVRQKWFLGPMITASVLELIEENGDGVLSRAEADAIREQSFSVLRDYNYFTFVLVDDILQDIPKGREFQASMKDGKLVYEFFVPLDVPVSRAEQEVRVMIFDQTFYTYVSLASDDGKGIDPTKDPLFTDPNAPARPEDFARFSDAVGLKPFSGTVRVAGNTQRFALRTEVEQDDRTAYYYGQIVPDSLVVRFKDKP